MSTFDIQVLQRFARMVERYPEHQSTFDNYVRKHVNQYPAALVDVAQQGEGALVRALTTVVEGNATKTTLTRILEAIPARTVDMRPLSVTCLQRLLKIAVSEKDYVQSAQLMSQLSGRLRELGAPEMARKLLDDLMGTDMFSSLNSMIQAQLFINLGTVYADIGENSSSLNSHQRALELLERVKPKDNQWHHHISTTLINAAAASLRIGNLDQAETYLDRNDEVLEHIDDEGVVLRNHLLRFVWLTESGRFQEALRLGMSIEQSALDQEEISGQAFTDLVADAQLNLGSLLIEIGRANDALPRITKAIQLRTKVADTTKSFQAKLKLYIARIAQIEAAVLVEDRSAAAGASAVLNDIRKLKAQQPNLYLDEVLVRAIDAKIKAVLIDAQSDLNDADIEELLNLSESNAARGETEDIDRQIRALHSVSMVLAKQGKNECALSCAQRAVALAQEAPHSDLMQFVAKQAVLYDGLSRRYCALQQDDAGITQSEQALTLIVQAWRQDHSAYDNWFHQILNRYLLLCEDMQQVERFQATCRLLDLEVEISN